MKYRPISDPEAITRLIFEAPAELSHRELGERIGVGKDTVAAIRCGKKFPNVLPCFPRFDMDMSRTCIECLHFNRERIRSWDSQGNELPEHAGTCSIGIPESENIKYARGCGAFSRKPNGHP